MNISKTRFLALGVSVIGLGVICGTLLWLKLAPKSVYRTSAVQPLEGLGNYGSVPEFSLVERSGKRVTLADMRGKVWIADFIYTNCEDTCPLQSAAMAKLQDKFGNYTQLRLVSFSVDPDRDTPHVLSGYAKRFNADAAGWLFLTGAKEEIVQLVQLGFALTA
ncbi:MAG: SCO family protein, partial [Deltaproteobacteria bacterium]|nr:SCO family protein [Deltaproteobacteria bacterium]